MTTSQQIRPSGNYSPAAIVGNTVVSAGSLPGGASLEVVLAVEWIDEPVGDPA